MHYANQLRHGETLSVAMFFLKGCLRINEPSTSSKNKAMRQMWPHSESHKDFWYGCEGEKTGKNPTTARVSGLCACAGEKGGSYMTDGRCASRKERKALHAFLVCVLGDRKNNYMRSTCFSVMMDVQGGANKKHSRDNRKKKRATQTQVHQSFSAKSVVLHSLVA